MDFRTFCLLPLPKDVKDGLLGSSLDCEEKLRVV